MMIQPSRDREGAFVRGAENAPLTVPPFPEYFTVNIRNRNTRAAQFPSRSAHLSNNHESELETSNKTLTIIYTAQGWLAMAPTPD